MTRLNHANTTNVRNATRLGCRATFSVFNGDDNDIPIFGSSVRPKADLTFFESLDWNESFLPGNANQDDHSRS